MIALYPKADGSYWYRNAEGELRGFEEYNDKEIKLLREIEGRKYFKIVDYENIDEETSEYIKLMKEIKQSGLNISFLNNSELKLEDRYTNKSYTCKIKEVSKREYSKREIRRIELMATLKLLSVFYKEIKKDKRKRKSLELSLLSTSAFIFGYEIISSINNNESTILNNELKTYEEELIDRAFYNLEELGIVDGLKNGYYKPDLLQNIGIQSDPNHLTVWSYYHALQKIDGLDTTTKTSLKDQLFIYINHTDGAYTYKSFNDYCLRNNLIDKDGNPSIDKFNEKAINMMKEDIKNHFPASARITTINKLELNYSKKLSKINIKKEV